MAGVLQLKGMEQLRRALKKQPERFIAEMARALPAEARALMGQANAAAPRVSGELAGSSSVTELVQVQKGRVRVAAAYLDEKAAAVHEGVHWGQHIEGTAGFKWFERALFAFEPGFGERIVARLKALTEGSGT